MIPRGKVDIGYTDLLVGLACCMLPGSRDRAQSQVETFWSTRGHALACLSVRSGFDLLLQSCAFPPGSEVLVSAITIRDMVRILEEHRLVPVPVDLDMAILEVKSDCLERAITSRTKALLVAHVFGSRMDLDGVAEFARRHRLFLIEDCAQAYVGNDYGGHPDSDVAMFSFGPTKTNTALGGAILRIRDADLQVRMRSLQKGYADQTRFAFLKRVCEYMVLKSLTHRRAYQAFTQLLAVAGKAHDEVISRALRGFPGPDLLSKIRQQPSYPLLALLSRRLRRFDPQSVRRRIATAETAIEVMDTQPRPGVMSPRHAHWLFPVESARPEALVRHLWRRGFDATRAASSMYAVPAPSGRIEPIEARNTMERIVYLPVHPGVTRLELERMAKEIEAFRSSASRHMSERQIETPTTSLVSPKSPAAVVDDG